MSDQEHLNFMIDLETLGTEAHSLVWVIGAVPFTFEDGALSTAPGLRVLINPQLAQAQGARISATTVGWWMKQTPAAQERYHEALRSGVSEQHAMSRLTAFMTRWGGRDRRRWQPWGNGALFDLGMLEQLCQRNGTEVPWHFVRPRCYRTVTQLAEANGWTSDIVNAGHLHDALDDANTQVLRLASACRHLGLQHLYTPTRSERKARQNTVRTDPPFT